MTPQPDPTAPPSRAYWGLKQWLTACAIVAVTVAGAMRIHSWTLSGQVVLLLWLEFVSVATICVIEAKTPTHGRSGPLKGRWLIPVPILLMLLSAVLNPPYAGEEARSAAQFLGLAALAMMVVMPFWITRGFRPWYVILVWTAYFLWFGMGLGFWIFATGGRYATGG